MDSQLPAVFNDFTFKILLFKFFKIQNVKGNFNFPYRRLISSYKDDKSFYLKIKNLKKNSETEEYNDHEAFSYVARKYSSLLESFIHPDFVYLDIGCGTGFKANKLGRDLSLNPDNVYGVDIPHWSLLTEEQRGNMLIKFQFMNENEIIPHENNKFDFVSVFMVLHHVKNLELLIKEISRIIKKDGILVIRDHDIKTKQQQIITDAEHHLYDYIKVKDYNHLEDKEYYTRYFSIEQWKKLFEEQNFSILKCDYDKNARGQINPTRAFHMVMKKT